MHSKKRGDWQTDILLGSWKYFMISFPRYFFGGIYVTNCLALLWHFTPKICRFFSLLRVTISILYIEIASWKLSPKVEVMFGFFFAFLCHFCCQVFVMRTRRFLLFFSPKRYKYFFFTLQYLELLLSSGMIAFQHRSQTRHCCLLCDRDMLSNSSCCCCVGTLCK